MWNLHPLTRSQTELASSHVPCTIAGNLPPLSEIFLDTMAPVARTAADEL
jgi:hypothetical protein